MALLHADVSVELDIVDRHAQWALQLWACDTPFDGGSLSGVKIAEATLPLPEHTPEPQRMDAETLASLPGGHRDYSMVLVLASGAPGAFNQIHDFANYPARERFITPHLEGSVGYQIDGEQVVLRAEQIHNPRSDGNLSGSLALELWALPDVYDGSSSFDGTLLANANIGRISGGNWLYAFEQRVQFSVPPAGRWHFVVMLREWAVGGYVTRDYCTFAEPYVVANPAAPPKAAAEHLRHVHEASNNNAATAPTTVTAPTTATAPTTRVSEPILQPVSEPILQPASEPILQPVSEPRLQPASDPILQPVTKQAAVEKAKVVALPERDVSATTPGSIASPAARVEAGKVSIMHASVEDLAGVKGLTRKIAVEIVKGRPYATLDDVVRVRGIGTKLLAKLRQQLTL